MSLVFLSDSWFDRLEELGKEFGDFEVPEKMENFIVNITALDGGNGNRNFRFDKGRMERGHAEISSIHLRMPIDIAKKVFLMEDKKAAIAGIMMGKIKAEGDLSRLKLLQSIKPTEDQKKMLELLRSFTN